MKTIIRKTIKTILFPIMIGVAFALWLEKKEYRSYWTILKEVYE
jgi:hypothetical protein